MRIQDEQPESYFRELRNHLWVKILKFFDEDPGYGMAKNSDPGWKKFGSGINIPYPQHRNFWIFYGDFVFIACYGPTVS